MCRCLSISTKAKPMGSRGGPQKLQCLIYCHLSGLGAPDPTGDSGLKSPTVGGRGDRDGEHM